LASIISGDRFVPTVARHCSRAGESNRNRRAKLATARDSLARSHARTPRTIAWPSARAAAGSCHQPRHRTRHHEARSIDRSRERERERESEGTWSGRVCHERQPLQMSVPTARARARSREACFVRLWARCRHMEMRATEQSARARASNSRLDARGARTDVARGSRRCLHSMQAVPVVAAAAAARLVVEEETR